MTTKLNAKLASRIATLVREISVARSMMDDGYDFALWADYSDRAKLELRAMGIDLGKTYAEIRNEVDAEIAARIIAQPTTGGFGPHQLPTGRLKND